MRRLKPELEQYERKLKAMKPTDPVKGAVAFEIAWLYYPVRIGKKEAKRHFLATVKNKRDWTRHIAAFNYYVDHVQNERRVGNRNLRWQYGSTWFNNWEDWAVMAEEEKTDSGDR